MFRNRNRQKVNHAPVQGYETPSRYTPTDTFSFATAQAGLQLAHKIRQDYDEAYGEFEHHDTVEAPHQERLPLGNPNLPIAAYKEQIQQSVLNNRITIIMGETGSGKSTQVPQYLHELGFDVDQTQPRRIAASEVSERIGEEIIERWPDTPREISAYQTAEKNTMTDDTHITNVTAGLLYAQGYQNRRSNIMKRKQSLNPNERISGNVMTCLITDEVHEQTMDTEMELALIRERVVTHPEMRFVIQSATMDTTALQKYFGEVMDEEPPVIEVPGRTFGVEKKEYPDETSVERAITRIIEMHELDKQQKQMVAAGYEGPLVLTDFMVVCPGKREIKDWTDEILKGLPKEIAETIVFPPLHSKMSYEDQKKAFRTDYPGLRIPMATDTAKTSLTVPGLGGVIDCSYARHEEIDEDGVRSLVLYATSYADRMQWAGRVGRIAPGWCDYTRYDKDMPFITLNEADPYETPESQRTNPDRYILRTAAMGVDFAKLKFMHPINQDVIARSNDSLRVLGALDENDEITTIGKRMNEFPIGTSAARMMIEADQYSPQVRSYMAAIVASMEVGGLPMYTHDAGKNWKALTDEQESDLLAQLDIFIGIQSKKLYELQDLDLDVKNVQQARLTYGKVVRKSSAQIGELLPPTQDERELLKLCIYAGMPDSIYRYAGDNTYKGISKDQITPRSLSNRSVVSGKHAFVAGTPRLIERYVKAERIEKHIVESLTIVDDIRVLGRVALSQCEWKQEGDVKWRDGRPILTARQFYKDVDLGQTKEMIAEPSKLTRDAVIAYALAHPGEEQRKIRAIKGELERFAHLTNQPVPQLTQDELVNRIRQAAPEDILDPFVIEYNLHGMNVTIDDYLSKEEQQAISDNAPDVIEEAGMSFHISYQSGQPLVRRYEDAAAMQLSDEMYLPDGRQVLFVHDRKRLTVAQLRQALS